MGVEPGIKRRLRLLEQHHVLEVGQVTLSGTDLVGANGANPVVTFGTTNATIVSQFGQQVSFIANASGDVTVTAVVLLRRDA